MRSAVLLVTDDCIRVYPKSGTDELFRFNPVTDDAVRAAAEKLVSSGIVSVSLLLDLPDEEFFHEPVELGKLWVTKEQVQTRLRRNFPTSKLARVHICRLLTKATGDFSVMIAGLRRSSAIETLIESLQHFGLAVSGTYSLSLAMMNLLQPEIGTADGYRFLISADGDRFWRYSLYYGPTLLFSRCAVSRARDPWADIYNEIRETLKYARVNGLLPDKIRPGFYYLAPLMPLTVLGMHLQKKLGLRHPLQHSPYGSLYQLCVARFTAWRNPLARYDQPEIKSPYRKLLAAHIVLFASIASCGLALWTVGSTVDKSLATAGYSKSLQANIQILSNRMEELKLELSAFGVEATEVEHTVNMFSGLDREGDVRMVLSGLASALSDFPQIRLEKLRWVRATQSENDSDLMDMTPRSQPGKEKKILLLAELSVHSFSGALYQQKYREDFMSALGKQGLHSKRYGKAELQNQFRSGALSQDTNTKNPRIYSFEVLMTRNNEDAV